MGQPGTIDGGSAARGVGDRTLKVDVVALKDDCFAVESDGDGIEFGLAEEDVGGAAVES